MQRGREAHALSEGVDLADGIHGGEQFLDAVESIKALSEQLGHSDSGLTMRTYSHLMPQH